MVVGVSAFEPFLWGLRCSVDFVLESASARLFGPRVDV